MPGLPRRRRSSRTTGTGADNASRVPHNVPASPREHTLSASVRPYKAHEHPSLCDIGSDLQRDAERRGLVSPWVQRALANDLPNRPRGRTRE